MSLLEKLIDESVSCGRCGTKGVGNCVCWDRKTIFSEDRVYRYLLWREWKNYGKGKYVMFIGLNPSTADERQDDPTIRRCVNFAKRWGYDAMLMTNLFAFRATKPRDMKRQGEPVGPDNDHYLLQSWLHADKVIAAWGPEGKHLGRDQQVIDLLGNLYCLGTTQEGHPRHPLMLKRTVTPIPYAV